MKSFLYFHSRESRNMSYCLVFSTSFIFILFRASFLFANPPQVSPAKRGDGPRMCAATSAALLTDHQLEKVKSSDSWRIDPALRLARLDGGARTLMASYLGGFALKSEFVWVKGAFRMTNHLFCWNN